MSFLDIIISDIISDTIKYIPLEQNASGRNNKLKAKKGPHFKTSLLEQIVLTLFKLKYSLPDRILESLFKIDHVTISRYVLRISKLVSKSSWS